MDPKLRNVDKAKAPYLLNTFPRQVVITIARDIIFSLHTRGDVEFEGPTWERTFAKAITASWKPSNVGLDDVVLGNCCWGAKTVKCPNPFDAERVRLISGRNSIDYSFGEADVRQMPPSEVGRRVLSIWNERVSAVRSIYKHARTVVLLKGPGLLTCAIFEYDTVRFEPERYSWDWNVNKNLEGRNERGEHRFTWQPHGSQFTIVEPVPPTRARFTIKAPPDLSEKGKEALLGLIGFNESWITIE